MFYSNHSQIDYFTDTKYVENNSTVSNFSRQRSSS